MRYGSAIRWWTSGSPRTMAGVEKSFMLAVIMAATNLKGRAPCCLAVVAESRIHPPAARRGSVRMPHGLGSRLALAVVAASASVVAACARPSGGSTDPSPSAPSSSLPDPHAAPAVERCTPLTPERAEFWAHVLPSGVRVDLRQPNCGMKKQWEWVRCGDRVLYTFARPSATVLKAVYDLNGALVGVHGRFQPEPAPEVCEGEKPVGPCGAFACGRILERPGEAGRGRGR